MILTENAGTIVNGLVIITSALFAVIQYLYVSHSNFIKNKRNEAETVIQSLIATAGGLIALPETARKEIDNIQTCEPLKPTPTIILMFIQFSSYPFIHLRLLSDMFATLEEPFLTKKIVDLAGKIPLQLLIYQSIFLGTIILCVIIYYFRLSREKRRIKVQLDALKLSNEVSCAIRNTSISLQSSAPSTSAPSN